MKTAIAFFAGAACVALGVMIGRGRPVQGIGGPDFAVPEDFNPPPAADSPLRRPIASIDFDRLPFQEALAKLAAQAGLNINVRWSSIEATGTTREQPVDLHLHNVSAALALDSLLFNASATHALRCSLNRGIVEITDGSSARRIFVVYDLTEQIIHLHQHAVRLAKDVPPIPRSPDSFSAVSGTFSSSGQAAADADSTEWIAIIAKTIEDGIDNESWKDNGGNIGTIQSVGSYLFVNTTPANQQQIAGFLAKLCQ